MPFGDKNFDSKIDVLQSNEIFIHKRLHVIHGKMMSGKVEEN